MREGDELVRISACDDDETGAPEFINADGELLDGNSTRWSIEGRANCRFFVVSSTHMDFISCSLARNYILFTADYQFLSSYRGG